MNEFKLLGNNAYSSRKGMLGNGWGRGGRKQWASNIYTSIFHPIFKRIWQIFTQLAPDKSGWNERTGYLHGGVRILRVSSRISWLWQAEELFSVYVCKSLYYVESFHVAQEEQQQYRFPQCIWTTAYSFFFLSLLIWWNLHNISIDFPIWKDRCSQNIYAAEIQYHILFTSISFMMIDELGILFMNRPQACLLSPNCTTM